MLSMETFCPSSTGMMRSGVIFRRTEAVDARHRGHDDDVAPREKRVGGGVPELVDVVVDGRILLDVGVGRRHVGFGLIVVVIGNEIFHRVFGKKRAELAVELSGERLVVGKNERRTVGAGNDVGHGERLAGTGNAEKHLIADAGVQVGDKFVDGGGLIPGGRKGRMKLKKLFGHVP